MTHTQTMVCSTSLERSLREVCRAVYACGPDRVKKIYCSSADERHGEVRSPASGTIPSAQRAMDVEPVVPSRIRGSGMPQVERQPRQRDLHRPPRPFGVVTEGPGGAVWKGPPTTFVGKPGKDTVAA